MQTLTQQRLDEIFAAHQNGNFELLLQLSQQLQHDFPNFVLGYKAAGIALMALQRKTEAVFALQQAVKCDPNDDENLSNLGQILIEIANNDEQKFNEAIEFLLKALQINPKNAVAYNNLAAAYLNFGDLVKAKKYAEQALEIAPNYGAAHNNLSVIFSKYSHLVSAVKHAELAVKFSPDFSPAWTNLIGCTLNLGEAEKASQIADVAIKMPSNKDNFEVHSAKMRNDHYLANADAILIRKNIKNFQRFLVEKFRRKRQKMEMFDFKHFKNSATQQKIRIGLVSGDLNSHPVARFLLNLLPKLQNLSMEIFAYSNCLLSREDATSQKLRQFCKVWKNIATLSDLQTAEIIYADKVQILFDLSGHTDRNRLEMFALKPSPIQIS